VGVPPEGFVHLLASSSGSIVTVSSEHKHLPSERVVVPGGHVAQFSLVETVLLLIVQTHSPSSLIRLSLGHDEGHCPDCGVCRPIVQIQVADPGVTG
jgi:hypothetical protein